MTINIQDPLFLLTEQTGLTVGELADAPAVGNPDINKAQEVLKTGEPIPVLFARFRNGAGGVMIQPKMTEASFSNDIDEEEFSDDGGATVFVRPYSVVNVKFLLVLSEGNLPLVQIRDIFHGSDRKGTFNQAYDGRAGTWAPANDWDDYLGTPLQQNALGYYEVYWSLITTGNAKRGGDFIYYKDTRQGEHVMPYIENTFPVFCGTSGSYSGLTTLSFEYTAEQQSNSTADVLKGINLFVRNGLQVTRLVDGVTAESDNFADLVKYLLTANDRLVDDLVDTASLTISAKFTDANGFLFNGAVTESQNLLDWIQATSKNFLLRLSKIDGKIGLLPQIPYNADFTIKTTKVDVSYTFTEEHIVPDGFEIQYISLEDREPVCFNVEWRQQPESDFGLVRTVAVRYNGEAPNGPFVSIDMSNYCTNEDHAVKIGAFHLARRRYITHHLRLTVRERNYNTSLAIGDIVRVRLRRETSEGDVEYHDKVYEINRIEKGFDSVIVFDLTHFPVDSQGASIVAQEVDAAEGAGNVIDVGRTDFDGDENDPDSSATVGTASGGGGSNQPGIADTDFDFDRPDFEDTPYPEEEDNPEDPLEESIDNDGALGHSGSGSAPAAGDNASVPEDALPCDGRVCFYRQDKNGGPRQQIRCVDQPLNGEYFSSITTADIDHYIIAIGQCEDPSSPDGYGPEIFLGQIGPAEPDPTTYGYVRWVGTKSKICEGDPSQNFTIPETTAWIPSTNFANVGLRGMYGCPGAQPILGSSGPFTGPCVYFAQWRSSVWASAGSCSGGNLSIGGVLSNGCFGGSGGAHLRFGCQSVANASYRISGKWEFSDDASTIEVTWDGRPDDAFDEEGNLPDNTQPGGGFSC